MPYKMKTLDHNLVFHSDKCDNKARNYQMDTITKQHSQISNINSMAKKTDT